MQADDTTDIQQTHALLEIVKAFAVCEHAMVGEGLDGPRRLDRLMEAHGILMAACGPGHLILFDELMGRLTGDRAGSLEGLLPDWIDSEALAGVRLMDSEGVATEDGFDFRHEAQRVLRAAQKVGKFTGQVTKPKLDDEYSQEAVFSAIKGSFYQRHRSTLVENPTVPAGSLAELKLPSRANDFFKPIAQYAQFNGWWWPCPACKWPMKVTAARTGTRTRGRVRCLYPVAERNLIRQVMALMAPEWTDTKKLRAAVLALLGTLAPDPDLADRSGGSLRLPAGDPQLAEAVIPRVGGDFLGYAQRVTGPFFTFGKRPKAQAFAGPGILKTRTAYLGQEHGTTSREIHIQATPGFLEAPGHEVLPQVHTRPQRDRVAPTVNQLLDVAKILSGQDKSVAYLHKVLKRFFEAMKTTDGELTELDLTSGDLQVLNAPTGSGKTVLVRVMASWAALNDRRIALAVTDVRATLDMAWDINNDLAYLHKNKHLAEPAHCTPLMSPSSMHRRAMDYAALGTSTQIDEWDRRARTDIALLSAGCAQRALMDPPTLYPYGEENCTSLTSAATGSTRLTCSFAPVCGKFQQFYRATDAAVIVTNHANLLEGRTRIGVVLDGQEFRGKARGTRGMSVLEMTLRACDALVIDEIDAFQTAAISRCTSELTLASRKRTTALREIDSDARNLPVVHEMALAAPVSHARLMAEMLLLWLCSGSGLRLNPGNQADSPDGASPRQHRLAPGPLERP